MRKLASVQYVHDITPIEKADRLELAHVLGWQVAVPKGQFHVGDLAVYFEIDSFLPIEPRYEFLRKSFYQKNSILGEGFRIRTQTLRGALSQGLLLPLSEFPKLYAPVPGLDLTLLLNVKKWRVEQRATDSGTIIGTLPPEVPHTDETRVQVQPDLIEKLGKQPYYITTKMDGSSHSIELDADNQFLVTGHNYQYADDGKSSFYELVKKMQLEPKLRKLKQELGAKTLVVQGEFCAPGIQGNPIHLNKPHWYVFTVLLDGKRQGLSGLRKVAALLDCETVPVEEIGDRFSEKYPTVEAVLHRADQSMYHNGREKIRAEGIVVRPLDPVWDEDLGDWLSMKAVSNKYLLKKKE